MAVLDDGLDVEFQWNNSIVVDEWIVDYVLQLAIEKWALEWSD